MTIIITLITITFYVIWARFALRKAKNRRGFYSAHEKLVQDLLTKMNQTA
jgi:hypothetical protein